MKRIEFIAPVEAMRGNLSGTQKNLQYPTDNNAAYESPVGSRNYAQNYRPSFIGAKRAADGLKYFNVRTKSSIGMTSKAKHAMALLGGTGAIYASIVRDKTATLYGQLHAMYVAMVEQVPGFNESFKKWLSRQLYQMLANKSTSITIAGPGGSIQIDNPWVKDTAGNVQVAQNILVKFWSELAQAGSFTFKVDGATGVAYQGETFDDVISSNHNILGLTTDTVGSNDYVKRGTLFLLNGADEYVKADDDVEEYLQYILTDVAPA